MPTLTFAVPLCASQAEAWRRLAQELRGSRCAAHALARQRLGIQREALWLNEARAGALVVAQWEASNLAAAMSGLETSDQPFDIWFREQWLALAGSQLARSARVGRLEQLFEWNAAERSAAEQKNG